MLHLASQRAWLPQDEGQQARDGRRSVRVALGLRSPVMCRSAQMHGSSLQACWACIKHSSKHGVSGKHQT